MIRNGVQKPTNEGKVKKQCYGIIITMYASLYPSPTRKATFECNAWPSKATGYSVGKVDRDKNKRR